MLTKRYYYKNNIYTQILFLSQYTSFAFQINSNTNYSSSHSKLNNEIYILINKLIN